MGIPVVADPYFQITQMAQFLGYFNAFQDVELAIDYPNPTDQDNIRQYVKGSGGPIVNFLAYVDVGVGWSLEPRDFETEEDGIEAKKMAEQFQNKIDLITTLIQLATYREVLGRGAIVKTYTIDGEDFYFDEKRGVCGVDCINPMTLTPDSINKVLADGTGQENYVQTVNMSIYNQNNAQNNGDVKLSQDRVYYVTRNPMAKRSPTGVSLFSNCTTELKFLARMPRYRSQMGKKFANVHRHYVVNTEKLQAHPYGAQVLLQKDSAKKFLNEIHEMVTEQEQRGASIATYDYLDSKEITYAGKEPDISGLERASYEALAFKTEIPLNVLMYGADVNRATLEKITNFFVKRRQNGPQGIYKRIIENILNEYISMKGYRAGRLEVSFNPFLDEDVSALYAREADLYNKIPELKTKTELRRAIGMPDTPQRGPADDYADEQARKAQENAMSQQKALMGLQKNMQGLPANPKAAAPSNRFNVKPPSTPVAPEISKQRAKAKVLTEDILETALIQGGIIKPLKVVSD